MRHTNGSYIHFSNASSQPGQCPVDPVPAPAAASPAAQSCTPSGISFGNPLIAASAEKVQSESDFSGTGPDPLSFTRTYRSQWAEFVPSAGLGDKWNHEHAIQLAVNGDFSVVRFADGSLRRFSRLNDVSPWQPNAGADTLAGNLIGGAGGAPGFLYRRIEDDAQFQFNANGQLLSQTQRNGLTRTYSYTSTPAGDVLTQVSNHFGRTLTLAYTAATGAGGVAINQLTSVTAPDGQLINYEFDSSNRLTTVRYAEGAGAVPASTSKVYGYNHPDFPLALTSITDENNKLFASFTYDSIARALSTERAGGTNRFAVTYTSTNLADPVQVVDPLGTTRNFSFGYQGSKLAVTSADLPTPGFANAATRVQNTDGTLASETDYQGNTTQYTWESPRRLPLSTTRAVGTPLAQTTSSQWHASLPLKTASATPGRITTWVYNGQPDPFNGGALAACAPSTALLPDASPIMVLCKQVDLATTDTNGALGFAAPLQASVPARVSTWTYNANAQVLTSTDPAGATSTQSYYTDTTVVSPLHRVGDLASSTNALGHVTRFDAYNAAGNLLASTDANGVATTYVYDARQRLVSMTTGGLGGGLGGGLTTTRTYTPSGQLLRVTQPDGSFVQHSYDAAQRLVGLADRQGNTITYTLDNAGKRTAEQVKDPAGVLTRQVSRLFDALGRSAKTIGLE